MAAWIRHSANGDSTESALGVADERFLHRRHGELETGVTVVALFGQQPAFRIASARQLHRIPNSDQDGALENDRSYKIVYSELFPGSATIHTPLKRNGRGERI